MIAAKYPTRFLRSYVRAKLARDPMYEAVLSHVRESTEPLLDVGCGVGVLEAFLRARGVGVPIVGIDFDAAKVAVARQVVPDAAFQEGDARSLPPFHGTVVILDVLHYLTTDEQQQLLGQALDRTSGLVIVREGVRDGSMRYRLTVAQETFARAVRWLRVPRLNFPTVEQIVAPFHARGFEVSVAPMWGKSPLNNYLFVFNRASSGITNS
ncbi:MAG TPA: methyltransferase domain-containing protein [Thermoanaerobaculia bacterium]|nr:methyltransferase domain-containing protein [Thermoanaerobaculia bacterium]